MQLLGTAQFFLFSAILFPIGFFSAILLIWGLGIWHRKRLFRYIKELNRLLEEEKPWSTLDQKFPKYQELTKALSHAHQVMARDLKSCRQELKHTRLMQTEIAEKAKKQTANLIYNFTHDRLTGLPNRLLLLRNLERMTKKGDPFVLAILGLDDQFEKTILVHGTDCKNEAIKAIAARLKQLANFCARLENDEFVFILYGNHDPGEVINYTKKILRHISEPIAVKNRKVSPNARLGFTIFPNDNSQPATLLHHAYQSLLRAKSKNLSRYHMFSVEKNDEEQNFHQYYHRIEEAFIKGEFQFHYQPKVNMRTGEILGAEALMRWVSSEGMISPAIFIPIVENSDLIEPIGRWALSHAILQLESWHKSGLGHPRLSINISAKQLQDPRFIRHLKELFERHPDISPHQLELEILERLEGEDIDSLCRLIGECRRLGCHIAMDDFGTGSASLEFFKKLPLDVVKIDQAFVRPMLAQPEDRLLVEFMIRLGKLFSKEIIAEGVESEEHGRLLLSMGCEWGQGYSIARPMPAEDFLHWCRTWHPPPSWKNP